MNATENDVFDTTVYKSNNWLGETMRQLNSRDKLKAYLAIRATLHALRDRLEVEESAHLAGRLPMLLRGLYYEGWDPIDKPLRMRTREEFLERVREELGDDEDMEPAELVKAVFAMLEEKLGESELEEVKGALPQPIREFWPRPGLLAMALARNGHGERTGKLGRAMRARAAMERTDERT